MSAAKHRVLAPIFAVPFCLAAVAPAFAEDAKPSSDLASRVLQAQIKSDEKKADDAKKVDYKTAPPASGSPSSPAASTAAPRPLGLEGVTLPEPVVPGSVGLPAASTPPPATVLGPRPGAVPPVAAIVDPSPRAAANSPAAVATSGEITYTVAAGDTFTSIAKAKYGDENRWHLIAAANPTVDPNRLKIHTVLKLPDPAEHDRARAAEMEKIGKTAEAPGAAGAAAAGTVKVEHGDTLSIISKRVYGDSKHWRLIFEANKEQIDHADDLTVGTTLKIPAKPAAKPSAVKESKDLKPAKKPAAMVE